MASEMDVFKLNAAGVTVCAFCRSRFGNYGWLNDCGHGKRCPECGGPIVACECGGTTCYCDLLHHAGHS